MLAPYESACIDGSLPYSAGKQLGILWRQPGRHSTSTEPNLGKSYFPISQSRRRLHVIGEVAVQNEPNFPE